MRRVYLSTAIVMIGIVILVSHFALNSIAEQDADAKRQDKLIATLEKETYTHVDLAETVEVETVVYKMMTPKEFRERGVIEYNGWKFTYYSENVLPGGGLEIPGRHSDGTFVRDENGFLCVACNDIPQGELVDTPFGLAIVYDLVGEGGDGVIDIYVSFE